MTASPPSSFDADFRDRFLALLRARRDVRRFRRDPLPPGLVERLIETACLAPSVGYAQPWRFVVVESPSRRAAVAAAFEAANQEALAAYRGERTALYATLKLAGLRQAPVHLAVYCAQDTQRGSGLGRQTMPETLDYSVVAAIQTLWLAARLEGVGLGWVSILDPRAVDAALGLPREARSENWHLVGYLCLGYPEDWLPEPELKRAGWEESLSPADCTLRR